MESHQSGKAPHAGASGNADDVAKFVRDSIAEQLDISTAQIQLSSTLIGLGAQSFDFVDLIFTLERAYSINLPRSFLLPDYYPISTLIDAILVELSASPKPVKNVD